MATLITPWRLPNVRLDGDYLGAAVAELKGDIAVDVDGAFFEQSDAEVWAEDQLVKFKVGGLLPVVVVGG